MHERGIVEDLIRHAESLCTNRSERVSRINLTVGALSGIDPGYVAEYVGHLTPEHSPLDGAKVVIHVSNDITDPDTGSVRIDSMTFEEV